MGVFLFFLLKMHMRFFVKYASCLILRFFAKLVKFAPLGLMPVRGGPALEWVPLDHTP